MYFSEGVMLIAWSSACRVQSLHLLSTVNIQKSFKSYTVFFEGLIKQNRPGWSENVLEFFSYFEKNSTTRKQL
jgi:hypothetical protein